MILRPVRITGQKYNTRSLPLHSLLVELFFFSFAKNSSVHWGLFHNKRKYSLRDQNTQQNCFDFLNVKQIMIHSQIMATGAVSGEGQAIYMTLQFLPYHTPILLAR